MSFDKALWDLFCDLDSNAVVTSEKAQKLCVDFLGLKWKSEGFKLSKVSGGMTNLVFKCQIKDETVLLRIQCEKDVMQLQNEVAIFLTLANHGLGPKLLGIFPGGRLEEFLPSRNLTTEETRTHRYVKHVAAAMARVHQVEVPLAKSSQVVSTMRQWLERIERNGGSEFELWSKNAGVPKDKHPAKVTLADLEREITIVEKFLQDSKSPAHLTHNDLFAANILLKDGFEIDEDGVVWQNTENGRVITDEMPVVLIDFEFGMYNYRGFDIGNFLNETGNAYFEEMPTYSMNLEFLSDKALHRAFCVGYLEETYKIMSKDRLEEVGLSGNLESDVNFLQQEAEKFQTISNLWWGVWNIICVQEGIPGMDFDSAFRDRLCLYFYFKSF